MNETTAVLDRAEVEEPAGPTSDTGATADEAEIEALEAQAAAAEVEAEAEAMEEVHAKASRAARGPASAFLERMAERVGRHARVTAAFGEPIVRGSLTVVPVARVAWGFGGGSGDAPEGAGSGGGGGSMVNPIGYLEITEEAVEFRPLRPLWAEAPLIIAWAFASCLVLRTLRGFVRR